MAGESLFKVGDLVNRLGEINVNRAFDHENTGEAREEALSALVLDSSAAVWAVLPPDFVLPALNDPARGHEARYIRKIALDHAQATAWATQGGFNRTQDGIALLSMSVKAINAYGDKQDKQSEEAATEGGGAVVSGSTTTSSGSVTSGESAFSSGSSNPWLR